MKFGFFRQFQKVKMSRIPTVASLLPDPLINGPDDTSSTDSWDITEYEGSKSIFKRLQFFFSCLGYSVGLGNIWRFPYMIHRNGGAFLLPFVIMVIFVGMPLYYLEIIIAQFTSRGPITIWDMAPFFKGIGFAMAIVSFFLSAYYNTIISWNLLYLMNSLHAKLPWNICEDRLFSPACEEISVGASEQMPKNGTSLLNGTFTQFYSEKYFRDAVLNVGNNAEIIGYPRWQLCLCLLLICCVISICLIRNIQTFGKISYLTSFLIIVFLSVFLVKVLSHGRQSYVQGVKFFFSIEWSRMKTSQVWIDAAYEVIFSLGPCFGGLIALASKNDFHRNCYRNAMSVVIINSVLSVFGGFVAYALLGHFGAFIDKSKSVNDSISDGMGLAFIVYPMALSELQVPQLWSALFFLTLFLIGLESSIGYAETVVQAICEISPHPLLRRRPIACLLVGFCIAGAGTFLTARNGLYLITLLDTYSMGATVLLIGLFECIVVVYIYGFDRLSVDMKAMFRELPSSYWHLMWKFITPVIISALFLFTCLDYYMVKMGKETLPHWAEYTRWSVTGSAVLAVLIYMVYSIIKRIIYNGSIRGICYSEREWGPCLPEKQKKLQCALYDTGLEPVLMVRVSVDPDEISPTGVMIGAKPDSVIPHGFYLNPNKKDNIKNKPKHWCVGPPNSVYPEELTPHYWATDINRFTSLESSHASSNKSVSRESLYNFKQATQTEDEQSDNADKNTDEEANISQVHETTNESMNIGSNLKRDKIINKNGKRISKDEITPRQTETCENRKDSRCDNIKAKFFLEANELDKPINNENDNITEMIENGKLVKMNDLKGINQKRGHENPAYNSD